jgi:hypothetical protein
MGTMERIAEALRRALALLPAAAQAKLKELAEPDSLLGFAIVLGVWGGLQLTPFGVAADLLLSAWGALSLGKAGVELVTAAIQAGEADTDEKLNASAKRIAEALSQIGIELIASVIANPVFKTVRAAAKAARPRIAGKIIAREPSKIEIVAERMAAKLPTAGAGAVDAAPKVGKAASQFLKVAIPLGLGAGLLAVLLARSGTRKVRRGDAF